MIKLLDPADEVFDFKEIFTGELKSIFKPAGYLQSALELEHRPEQEKMARRVCSALAAEEPLLFEAGTGVGKSLAYLLPSILYSKLSKKKGVIATNTISLQEQLIGKDIPMTRDLFDKVDSLKKYRDFRCALLVGRANYLCTNRLSRALRGQGDLFEHRQREELERIAEWASDGPEEGIRQEISPSPSSVVWDQVNADSSLCSPKNCQPDTCFYRRARSRVDQADLVILNHSLLFSLIGAGIVPSEDDSGVLFPDDFVIFDEAHEIPDVASDHLGISVSSWAMESFFKKLYNAKKGKGVLKRIGRSSDFEAIEQAELATEDFFNHLHLEVLGERDRLRLREPNSLPIELFPPFGRALRSLIELSDRADDEPTRLELKDQIKRGQAYLSAISEFIEVKDKSCVYWLERGGSRNQLIYLRSAPLSVASILAEELFAKPTSVIMTSATLTRKGSAATFSKQIGAEDVPQCLVSSPFDYEKNLSISIFNDFPEPMRGDRTNYLKYLVEAIFSLSTAKSGGTLVLFTNYADLHHCYEQLRPRWSKTHRSLYAQGKEFSRSELAKKMIEEGDVLLLGAESFWKGFDAKGQCLSQVILTRLPFENPNHPLLEAKSDMLEAQNKSAFREITLPSAVIKFRQGIGRLIRSQTDCGELVILDSRILNKNYGSEFLGELPKKSYQTLSLLDLSGEYHDS